MAQPAAGRGVALDRLLRAIKRVYAPDALYRAALLDKRRTGVVISSILHRDQARLYVKQVREGNPEYELSPEEQQAVDRALSAPANAAIRIGSARTTAAANTTWRPYPPARWLSQYTRCVDTATEMTIARPMRPASGGDSLPIQALAQANPNVAPRGAAPRVRAPARHSRR